MASFVRRGLGFLLRFFLRSVNAAIRCFFGFRDNARRLPDPLVVSAPSSSTTDVVISGNCLSSLLSKEEKEDSAWNAEEKGDSAWNAEVESKEYEHELNDEVDILKACGAIAGTPAELQKTPSSYVFKVQNTQHDSPDYVEGSWTRSPRTAYKTRKNEASVTPWPATETQKKNKSVRFESENDLVSYQSPPVDSLVKKNKSPDSQIACNRSPYPTPLKLFDEMQTPGTVYPASLDELYDGKHHVRSQFVYANCNPGENVLLTKLLEVQGFNSEQDSTELGVSVEQDQNVTPREKDLKKIENETESKLEASLSSWLEPASIIMKEGNEEMEAAADIEMLQSADMPIIGVVPAQMNEDDDSHIFSPKRREVNGIPNTTKKYKEDQTVKWHATPFEERLNKALSEEKFVSQRYPQRAIAKPLAFEDTKE